MFWGTNENTHCKKNKNTTIGPRPQTNTQGVQGKKTCITTQPQLKLNEGITKYAFQFYDKSIT
jgi:hypothetical protein